MFVFYCEIIGDDYLVYCGYVYCVIMYVMYFLNGDEEVRLLVEIVFVYYDIGFWIENELVYFEFLEEYVLVDNEKYGWGFDF